MKLSNVKLTLKNISRNSSDDVIEAVDTGIKRRWTETGALSKEIEHYTISCMANRADKLVVKLPPTLSGKITGLRNRLDAGELVKVRFHNIQLKAYAMLKDGNLLSGVSATADDFDIVESSDDELEVEL